MRRAAAILVLFMLMAGCACRKDPDSMHRVDEPDGKQRPAAREGWKRTAVPAASLEIEIPSAARVDSGTYQGVDYFWAEGADPPVKIGVRVGLDLSGWAAQLWPPGSAPTGAEEAATLCGHEARRRQARIAAQDATAAILNDKGAIGHRHETTPEGVESAVAFRHQDRNVVVTWTVPVERRDALRADEERFFAAIRCL
jgi:hypothetical protein